MAAHDPAAPEEAMFSARQMGRSAIPLAVWGLLAMLAMGYAKTGLGRRIALLLIREADARPRIRDRRPARPNRSPSTKR